MYKSLLHKSYCNRLQIINITTYLKDLTIELHILYALNIFSFQTCGLYSNFQTSWNVLVSNLLVAFQFMNVMFKLLSTINFKLVYVYNYMKKYA